MVASQGGRPCPRQVARIPRHRVTKVSNCLFYLRAAVNQLGKQVLGSCCRLALSTGSARSFPVCWY